MVSNVKRLSERFEAVTNVSGVTTASLIVIVLVATLVGVLTALLLGNSFGQDVLAMIAGVTGMVAAALLRNTLLVKAWGAAGVEDPGTPGAVIADAVPASIVGSLAAGWIAISIGGVPNAVTGGLAGLISAALLGALMIADLMDPKRHLRPGR